MGGGRVFLTHPETDRAFFFTAKALRRLRRNHAVILNPLGRPPTDAEILSLAPDCEVVVSEWLTGAGAEVFRANRSLKAFVRCGIEILNVDMEAATEAGVMVVATPAPFVSAVAEFTLGAMLSLSRGLTTHHNRVAGGTMSHAFCAGVSQSVYAPAYPGFELQGERLGIVGLGAIGREVARLARSFGMEVIACDPMSAARSAGVRMAELSEVLGTARFVSLHATLDPATRHMLGAPELRRMRADGFLVNTARGGLVDAEALAAALRTGTIAGAAVDVFEDEPDFSANPLLGCPNVLLTPHIAGVTNKVIARQADSCVEVVEEILAGGLPDTLVNVQVKDSPNLRIASGGWTEAEPGPRSRGPRE